MASPGRCSSQVHTKHRRSTSRRTAAERHLHTAIVFGRRHANAVPENARWSPSPVTTEAGAARRGPTDLLGLVDDLGGEA